MAVEPSAAEETEAEAAGRGREEAIAFDEQEATEREREGAGGWQEEVHYNCRRDEKTGRVEEDIGVVS